MTWPKLDFWITYDVNATWFVDEVGLWRGRKMNTVILIAGMPASGKTSFGDYLRDKKHFLHVDMEAFEGSYFHDIWEMALRAKRLDLFVETLKRESTRVVLTWGFPPTNLHVVRSIRATGVDLWWFDADEMAARKSFLTRDTVPIECFDVQVPLIREAWPEIEDCFQPNIIETLNANGCYLRTCDKTPVF